VFVTEEEQEGVLIKVVIKVFVAKSGANESMRVVLMGINKSLL
jgi:hypothetical protein